jgi:hypothetical protein
MSQRRDPASPAAPAGNAGLRVTRFHDASGHGWYVGQLGVWGLIAGESATWATTWDQYSEQTGVRVTDLAFANRQDFADFVRDIGL